MAVNGGRPSMRSLRSNVVEGDFLSTLPITILLFLTSTQCARSQGTVTQCCQPYLYCWQRFCLFCNICKVYSCMTNLERFIAESVSKKFKIGEYLAKLQART